MQQSVAIGIAVLEQPNLRLSGKREFGNRGSLAVAIEGPKAELWFDHGNGVGGGHARRRARDHGASDHACPVHVPEMGASWRLRPAATGSRHF